MRGSGTFILDFTDDDVRVGVADAGSLGVVTLVEDFSPRFRAAVRKEGETIVGVGGRRLDSIPESAQILVFDHLSHSLVRIQDASLQRHLIAAFCAHLCDGLADRGLLDGSGDKAGYAVVSHTYPENVLESFREAFSGDGRIKLVGFTNDAACLVIGFLQGGLISGPSEVSEGTSVTLCLIVANNDRNVEVCCFDYWMNGPEKRRVLIRDFFCSECGALDEKLRSRDWSGQRTLFISLVSSGLSQRSREALSKALNTRPSPSTSSELSPHELIILKMKGAALLAQLDQTHAVPDGEYEVETAFNIGLQINGTTFQPILSKNALTAATQYPISSRATFRLQGRAAGEMPINAYCGYSTGVEEATILSHFTIPAEVTKLLNARQASLSATLKLESSGRGELTLETTPQRKTVGRQTFALPAVMA